MTLLELNKVLSYCSIVLTSVSCIILCYRYCRNPDIIEDEALLMEEL